MVDPDRANPLSIPGNRRLAEALYQARAFHNLAALGAHAALSGEAPLWTAITPTLAFAVELYLKVAAATFAGGTFPRGHKLAELFAALPAHARQELERQYNQITAGVPTTTLAAVGVHQNILLGEVLDRGTDAFAKLRYAYETAEASDRSGLPDGFGLWWFVEVLKPYVEQLPMPGRA